MALLLDTHVLLWWLSDAPELGMEARTNIREADLVFVSAASVWEIAIKKNLKKIEVPTEFAAVLDAEPFESLPVSIAHAFAVEDLADYHRDPFDRLLIAQARTERLALLTADRDIQRYDLEWIAA